MNTVGFLNDNIDSKLKGFFDLTTKKGNEQQQSADPGHIDVVPPRVVASLDIEVGMTVQMAGLAKAVDLNGAIGEVVGLRHLVLVTLRQELVKVCEANLQFPALCLNCGSEVTSNCCYACSGIPPECGAVVSKNRGCVSTCLE